MILLRVKVLILKQSTVYVTNRDREYQLLAAEREKIYQDIRNYSVLKTITLTRGCSSLKKVYIPCIFLGLIPM